MADKQEAAKAPQYRVLCWGDCKNPANTWGKCRVSFANKFNLRPAFEGDVLDGANLPDEVVQSLLRNGYAEAVKE